MWVSSRRWVASLVCGASLCAALVFYPAYCAAVELTRGNVERLFSEKRFSRPAQLRLVTEHGASPRAPAAIGYHAIRKQTGQRALAAERPIYALINEPIKIDTLVKADNSGIHYAVDSLHKSEHTKFIAVLAVPHLHREALAHPALTTYFVSDKGALIGINTEAHHTLIQGENAEAKAHHSILSPIWTPKQEHQQKSYEQLALQAALVSGFVGVAPRIAEGHGPVIDYWASHGPIDVILHPHEGNNMTKITSYTAEEALRKLHSDNPKNTHVIQFSPDTTYIANLSANNGDNAFLNNVWAMSRNGLSSSLNAENTGDHLKVGRDSLINMFPTWED